MAVYRGELSLSDVLETCKKCKLAPMCLPNSLADDDGDPVLEILPLLKMGVFYRS